MISMKIDALNNSASYGKHVIPESDYVILAEHSIIKAFDHSNRQMRRDLVLSK